LKILLTGRDGQVGWELERALAPLGELVATSRAQLDLADPDAIRRVVREAKPQVIVNAAAYTAVDNAESEPALAMRINGEAPGVLAEEAKRLGALLVHYSTDYVFDGMKKAPYTEEDEPNPINAYGESKLAGEAAIRRSGCRHLVLRTSWVYSGRGRNFYLTMLRLADEGKPIRVVDDQFGAPTSALDLARHSARLLGLGSVPEGLLHLSASGETTWFGFASEIMRACKRPVAVASIPSSAYATPARRPRYSVLDNGAWRRRTGLPCIQDWRSALAEQAGATAAR
jgi:dTDP-4-dehydrorhamnose reductase